MSDLHNKIMNLRGVTEDDWTPNERGCYRIGHRDACHAAAELAMAADALIRQLEVDAARYRWLRDESNAAPDNTPTIYSSRKNGLILYGGNLDDAIDALKDKS